MSTTTESRSEHRTFFGHPWGLANLGGVEMWKLSSFYGIFRRPICRLMEGVR